MLIPLQQHYLLLPNSTIAEVIPRTSIEQNTANAEADNDSVNWREQVLPIIHLEELLNVDDETAFIANKLCIVNSINASTDTEFYAIPCTGSPQLITLNHAALQLTHDENSSDYLHCQIKIGNKVAFIPNLDQLEMRLEAQKQ
jgi:chemosensory pili system protein ChpC